MRALAAAAVLSSWAMVTAGAAEDPLRQTARGLVETHGGSIVTVKLVLKRRVVVQGQERGSSESQAEILGTVISPTGLTVVADSDSNPFGMFASDADGPKIDTDTSDVKLLLADGREVAARFVLRDRDLDLAFVQPEESDVKLPFLDLDKAAALPKPLDDLIFLYRAGKNLNREVSVSVGSVQTIVKKPRTFVVSDWLVSMGALGGPAFDASGALVGLVVLRRAPTSASDTRLRSPVRGMFDMITPVVLTVADIKTVAVDAAKAAEKPAQP